MLEEILFYIVILFSNIMQGITGFAGTILAMPLSLRLVGYQTAVPVLNVLGIISGIYVFMGNYKQVDWKELRKIVLIMGAMIVLGIGLRRMFEGEGRLLYLLLGVIVILIACNGFYQMFRGKDTRPRKGLEILLVAAGIVHGMFVCGGPLLIGYLSQKIEDKVRFRATISTIWIFLNSFLLGSQIYEGMWNEKLLWVQIGAVPFLLLGMFLGGCLYRRMSQKVFMMITYILLFLSGISLFIK
ncbi:hypothetical protein SAMN02910453_1170 [Lachnospiraceae bacterium A10]|nr:hypothetical protein SAMN02910453_1170 [Lachnospiraceae bacterium A10]